MATRAHITVGLGYGDEGKGATVDFLCRQLQSKLVIRYSGGAQAGHNVVLPSGHRHTFSQFGAGTFAGAETYLGPAVIIDPLAIKREASALVAVGVRHPFSGLQVDRRCLVATPIHKAANRQRERNRTQRHGSCGMGIGEARNYWLRYGSDAITADDMNREAVLPEKLELLRQRMLLEVPSLEIANFSAAEYMKQLPVIYTVDGPRYRPDTDVIFEGAQGILIDENYGDHPFTTWSDVTPRNAVEMCKRLGWEVANIFGCTRAYLTRHGPGPFPTVPMAGINDEGNPHNEWQGEIRFGHLSADLLQRSLKAAREVGGEITCLSVSCVDQLPVDNWAKTSLAMLSDLRRIAISGHGPTWENRRLW